MKRGTGSPLWTAGEIGSGASHGNMGLIVPSHSVPLAAPGVVTQGLKWMFDPDSPFYIKPRLDPVADPLALGVLEGKAAKEECARPFR